MAERRLTVVWNIPPMNRAQRRMECIPKIGILEKELNVPVDIVFTITGYVNLRSMIPMLHKLLDVTNATIYAMRNA